MTTKNWTGRTALLHGVRSDGDRNVDLAIEPLTQLGHQVVDVTIPKRLAIRARSYENLLLDLERLLDETREGDALIGHSNGGFLAAWATRFRRYSTVILVAPALARTFDISRSRGAEIWCVHSGGDTVLRMARAIPWPRWGSAGLVGLDMLDDRRNVRTTGGHSEIFEADNLEVWVPTWDRWIRDGAVLA